MKRIPIPDFRTVEEAISYAVANTPLKTALNDFQHRDAYNQYGDKARTEAMLCWEAASKGDKNGMLLHMKNLSRALPPIIFGYVGSK